MKYLNNNLGGNSMKSFVHLKSFLTNLSNILLMRSRVRKFGKTLNTNNGELALKIDSLQYLTPDISEEETNELYNSLIKSGFYVLEESNLSVLKAFLTRIRNEEIEDNELAKAEYWYIDLNLLSQLNWDELKKTTEELSNIFLDKKVVLIIDSIHLYFNTPNGFDIPDSFKQLINYADRFVSKIIAKDNIFIIGIRNR